MKKRAVSSPDLKRSIAPLFAIAALIVLLIVAGCTSKPAAEPVTSTPAPTVQTPVPTTVAVTIPTESPGVAEDKAFADAADACYSQTPVIKNLSARLTFATCIKNIPLPPGNCAQNYRYYVLKASNEDTSTAGYARETEINIRAREAYRQGEGYDAVSQQYVPCGDATVIKTSFYQ